MTFLLGRQAMLGQAPPTYRRSMTAVRLPCEPSVQARSLPAAPLPRTTTSYSSGCAMISSCESQNHDHLPVGLVGFHGAVRLPDVLEAEHARRLRAVTARL